MSRLILVCLLLFSPLFITSQSSATVKATDNLLQIGGRSYSVGDFKNWWERFRDDKSQKIDGIDTYIEWLLFLDEAKKMELDSLPEYRRKVDVFIKSRTLMLYKNEAIDSKIKLSDSFLYEIYLKDYVPRRLVSLIECNNFASAKKISDYAINDLNITTINSFVDQFPDDYVVHSSQWLRPLITPENWKKVLDNSKENSLSAPFLLDNERAGVLFVEQVNLATDTDFSSKKDTIFMRSRKKISQELTEKLLISLKKKYNVTVHQTLIDGVDLFDPDPTSLNDVVISSDNSNVKVHYLIEQCMRNKLFLKMKNREDPNIQKDVKDQMVDAMIANSLVSWEAAEQKYEEKEPFKDELLFHKQYSLFKAMENHIYSEVFVTQDQVNSFYTENQQSFTQQESVNIFMFRGEPDAIFKVWTKTLVGDDLLGNAAKFGVLTEMTPQTVIPLGHLQSESIKVLESLNEGDVSSPYRENDFTKLLKLVTRNKSTVEPLEKVQDGIIKMLLAQAKETKRRKYLEGLKGKNDIIINNTNWQAMLTEMSQ